MTDIPQVYLDEAVRRARNVWGVTASTLTPIVVELARTLQELGWQPPVDPMLVRAREIVAEVNRSHDCPGFAQSALDGRKDNHAEVRIALIALREGMGK